jgi:hypothetical protein
MAKILLHHIIAMLRPVCFTVGTCESDVEETDVTFGAVLLGVWQYVILTPQKIN